MDNDYLKEVIKEAGEIALSVKKGGLKVTQKEDNSPVTNADKLISDFIFQKLSEKVNEEIVCEERDNINLLDPENFWLIDPIDGTRSYIRGENTYTVNIALIQKGMPKIGFIYQPEIKKLYYTNEEGKLLIEHENEIYQPPVIVKEENFTAVIGSSYISKITKHFLKNNYIKEVLTIPSSIKLCLVAEGVADIYPRFGRTMEWDTAAGHALILARDGDVLDLEGNSLVYGKKGFENPHFFALSYSWIKKLPILC